MLKPEAMTSYEYCSMARDHVIQAYGIDSLKPRNKRAIECKRIVCLIMRNAEFSYPEIGDALDLDHTTVLHHVVAARRLVGTDPGFAARYSRFCDEIQEIIENENSQSIFHDALLQQVHLA